MTKLACLVAFAVTLIGFQGVTAAPTDHQPKAVDSKPGLTHEEYLVAITLNSTDGWEPMSRVPVIQFKEGETIDLGGHNFLHKRGGGNSFTAWRSLSCTGTKAFTAENFGCGVCVTTGTSTANRIFGAGTLWRQTIGGKYPTAYWYSGGGCGGTMIHKQGILSNKYESCDSAMDWTGGQLAQSVMLYQGC